MISSKYFDHTILKAEATEAQVAKICDEALANDFASVCEPVLHPFCGREVKRF